MISKWLRQFFVARIKIALLSFQEILQLLKQTCEEFPVYCCFVGTITITLQATNQEFEAMSVKVSLQTKNTTK